MTVAQSTTDAASGPPAVLARALTRRFGSTTAVDGLDLTVRRGEIYGFLGPNGAGKSTSIRMLCTLLRPTSGTAVVAGHDVVTAPQAVRMRIGAALQEASLDDGQTGRELLALQGRLYGLHPTQIRRRLDEVLDLVAIGDAIDRRIGTYSGGMKRRLDLAAAIVHRPEVVFLDEPTTGLDPESRARVWIEVGRLNRELGVTIFLTTHYLEEADALAHRVGIISGGRVLVEEAPDTLKRRIRGDVIVAEVDAVDPVAIDRLRQSNTVEAVSVDDGKILLHTPDASTALRPVVLELERSGVRVTAITVRAPSLDDVFREMTEPGLAREGVVP